MLQIGACAEPFWPGSSPVPSCPESLNGGSPGPGLPVREDEIGRNSQRSAFVAFGQEGEKDFPLLATLLHIADVIEEDAGEAIQFCQFLGQAQVALGSEQPLHQGRGGRPQDGMARLGQLIGHGGQGMTFAAPRLANDDDVGRIFEERPAFEAVELQAQGRREGVQIQGAESFLAGQVRLMQEPLEAPLLPLLELVLDQFVERGSSSSEAWVASRDDARLPVFSQPAVVMRVTTPFSLSLNRLFSCKAGDVGRKAFSLFYHMFLHGR